MSDVWKRWVGQVVDKEFPLHHFLAATNHSAVFLTQLADPQSRQAAIKFISADDPAAGQQLAIWKQIAHLSHPNLSPIYHVGRCRIDGMNLLYVVMECAEENLSQILPHRALTPDETRDMLNPVVDVLVYLHAKSLVHTHIKPSNLLAVGDLLKLSSDTILPVGQPREALREPDVYDAPEAAASPANFSTPASDIWSLGVTLVEALTQSAPSLPFENSAEPLVPDTLPQPYIDIARHSLLREPRRRWDAPQIAACLSGIAQPVIHAVPATRAAAASANSPLTISPSPISPLSVPLSPEPAIPLSKLLATAASSLSASRPRTAEPANPAAEPIRGLSIYLVPALLAAFILIVGIAALPRFFRFRTEPVVSTSSTDTVSLSAPDASTSPQSAPASKPAPVPANPANVYAPPSKPPDSITADSDPVANPPKPHDAAPSPAVLGSESSPSSAAMKAAASAPLRGDVLNQVLPKASEKALATIHGSFQITARVQVDPSGKVTDATLEDPGPSRYFANLTEHAAQQWQFSAPETDGQAMPSEWLIRFQFTSSGVQAFPTRTSP
jgi:TonB family protein